MISTTDIEWTHTTWNPVTGCTKVSAGCTHCYAERFALRLQAIGVPKYERGFKVTLHPPVLEDPFRWRKPRLVFSNSMSDLFHEDVPTSFIKDIFEVMHNNRRHVFQVLTKRTERLKEIDRLMTWPPNLWMGVTVERSDYLHRIDHLRETGAHIKWLCAEPLLGPLDHLDLYGIDWVVVGGESGPKSRPMKKTWVEDICDQCVESGVRFFFKQWGGTRRKQAGRTLDGKLWEEYPLTTEKEQQLTL